MENYYFFQDAAGPLIFSIGLLAGILIIYIKGVSSLIFELSEYRAKTDKLNHLCQKQEEELEHLRALIDVHKID